MKKITTLVLFVLSSIVGFSQSITFVDPNQVRRNENSWLQISGSGTHFTQSSALTITFTSNVDGSTFSSANFWPSSDTWCSGSVMIPETATPGLYSVSVFTSNQGTITLANALTVTNQSPVPLFQSLTPTSATNGQQVTTFITVRYGQFTSTNQLQVNLSGNTTYLTSDSVDVLNDSTLRAVFNIPANNQSDECYFNIITDNDYIYCYQPFTISGIDPEIVSISPNAASDGDHVDITLHTSHTQFTSALSLGVSLEGGWLYQSADSITIINDSLLIASFNIPLHTRSSICDVVVVVDGIGFREFGGFTINGINPELVDVSPAEGEQGATLDVTISGVDMFFNGASATDIYFYGNNGGFFSGTSIVVLNENQLKTTISIPVGAPLGFYTLNMYVNGDYYGLGNAFSVIDDGYPDPMLVSVSPNSAIRGQSLDVTITGANTHFLQASGLNVALSGPDYYMASTIDVLNDTQLKCRFDLPSNAQKGVYNLLVNDDGQNNLGLAQAFTIMGTATDPKLVSISPAMTFPGQGLDVTITGANTHFMASSSNMDMGIYSQSTSVFIQPTTFIATSNTTIVAHFEVPIDFPLGIYDFGMFSSIDGLMQLLQSVIINAVGLDEKEAVITNLYPNPVHENLYIDTKSPVRRCTIVDITGKQTVVDPSEFKQDNNHISIPINKLGLRKGIYFIRLETDNGFDYQKFIIE